MFKMEAEYPRTSEFLKHAVTGCGVAVVLHGKYETIVPGAEVTLETILPPEVHYARKLPPLVVGIYAVWASGSPEGADGEEKLFEGTVKQSLQAENKRGDRIVGLASPDVDPLIFNTANTEDMDYALKTYENDKYRALIRL